jgi:hypothetical protein
VDEKGRVGLSEVTLGAGMELTTQNTARTADVKAAQVNRSLSPGAAF